ncbi:MAG: guanylate kinase [Opitutae bacterium]|jgi:guanylate kinase|nr:guanylate kinase [Opitutae bacterium]
MKGIALVISGPAGVGKTTLCDRLLFDFTPLLSRVITVTTRKPRSDEVNGKDYIFMSNTEFEDLKNKNSFLEFAKIHNNQYGSLNHSVQQLLEKNHDVLLNIDVQGAASLKKLESNVAYLRERILSVFIMPEKITDLRTRLEKRGQDSSEEIERRLITAENEIMLHKQFDHVIYSKSKDEDYTSLLNIYRKHSKLLEM